ncbi:Transcription initiation factor TFIID subunit 15b [Camellia lanceoleosa]|nr:Transcription initiation factor TFIID subunit 15b [Camellia lanceoleosa]
MVEGRRLLGYIYSRPLRIWLAQISLCERGTVKGNPRTCLVCTVTKATDLNLPAAEAMEAAAPDIIVVEAEGRVEDMAGPAEEVMEVAVVEDMIQVMVVAAEVVVVDTVVIHIVEVVVVVDIKEEIVAVEVEAVVVAIEGMVIGAAQIPGTLLLDLQFQWSLCFIVCNCDFVYLVSVTLTHLLCGNLNFARRVECNKCGAPSAGAGDHGGSGGGSYRRKWRGRGGRNNNYDGGSGRGSNYDGGSGGGSRGGSYGSNQGRDDSGYGQVSHLHPLTVGGCSYPPSYGAPGGYGGNAIGDTRSGGAWWRSGGYDGGYGGGPRNAGGGYGGAPAEAPVKVGKIKQKRGFKDQWPWNIKIYTDEQGNNKGDAALSYEDPSAAHCGYKISVAMAERSAPRAPPAYGWGGGRGGYGGGGDRRETITETVEVLVQIEIIMVETVSAHTEVQRSKFMY